MNFTKRFFSTLIVALLSLFSVFALLGCGEDEDFTGVYRLSRLQYVEDGEVVTVDTGDLLDGEVMTEDFVVLLLNEDGTAKLTITGQGISDAVEGVWKQTMGGKAEITVGTLTQTVAMDWNRFTFRMDKWTVTFTKQGSFTGTYRLTSLQYAANGIVVTVNAGETFMDKELKENFIVMELNADGTLVLTFTDEVTDVTQGSWKVNAEDSSRADLSFAGTTQTVKMDRYGCVLKLDEWTITFMRDKA